MTISVAQRFVRPFESIQQAHPFGNEVILFGSATSQAASQLWISDGTGTGTKIVTGKVAPYGNAVLMNGYLYFQGSTRAEGTELWKTDGTDAGTAMVLDLQPNEPNPANPSYIYYGSDPYPATTFKDNVYFKAKEPHTGQYALYKTDGTEAGTSKVDASAFEKAEASDNYLYLTGFYGDQIFRTDGTTVTDLEVPSTGEGNSRYIYEMERGKNGMFFVVGNFYYPSTFAKLYYIDDNNSEWQLIKDFSSTGDVTVANLRYSGEKVFFSVSDEAPGNPSNQVWVSDATTAGTTMLKSWPFSPYDAGTFMKPMYAHNDGVVFPSYDASNGQTTTWFTDGTATGTEKIADLAIFQFNDNEIPAAGGNDFYFLSTTKHLVAVNASTPGLKIDVPFDQFQTNNSEYTMTAAGNNVFFTGNDGYGLALWTFDPAPEINVFYSSYQGSLINNANYQFGIIKVDTCRSSKLYIENVGQADLAISQIAVTEADWFLDDADIAATLKPGDKIELTITFMPVAEGQRNGKLVIYSNDQNESTYEIALAGDAIGFAKLGCPLDVTPKVKEILTTGSHSKLLLSGDVINSDASVGTTVGSFSLKDENGTIAYQFVDDPVANNYLFTIDGNTLKVRTPLKVGRGMVTVHVRAVREDETSVDDVFIVSVKGDVVPLPQPECWEGLTPMTFNIRDVAINSVGDFFAVGQYGNVIYSTDHGVTWKEKNVTGSRIYAYDFGVVEFVGKLGIIRNSFSPYGSSYGVYASHDDGETWSLLGVPSSGSVIQYVSFVTETTGVGIDAQQRLWTTIDGGNNWEGGFRIDGSNNVLPYASSKDIVIYRSDYGVNKTVDGGRNWEQITLPGNLNENTLKFLSDTDWFFITNGGVYESRDAGAYWYKRGELPASGNATFVSVTEDAIIINTENNGLYKSIDSGAGWTQLYAPFPSGNLQAVEIKGSYGVAAKYYQYGYYAGREIVRSVNGGATFEESNLLPGASFTDISFPTETTGFVSTSDYNDYGPYYKTTDGGVTWTPYHVERHFSHVWFKDEQVGFGAAADGMYKTIDGGDNWYLVHPGASLKYSFHGNKGVSMGSFMRWTENNGETWTDGFELGGSAAGQDLFMVNENVGYLTRFFAMIYKTIDGGKTWDLLLDNEDPSATNFFSGIWFFDEDNGMVGGEGGSLYKTTDGGDTWTKTYTNMDGIPREIFVRPNGEMLVLTIIDYSSYRFYRSMDGEYFELISTDYSSAWADMNENSITLLTYPYSSPHNIYKYARQSPEVSAPIVGGPSTVCIDASVRFTASAGPTTVVEWTFDGPGGIVSDGATATATFSQPGTFNVGARTISGCGNSEFSYTSVEVKEIGAPEIDGPAEVEASGIYTVKEASQGMRYGWSAGDNAYVRVTNDEAFVAWEEPTTGTVQLTQTEEASGCRSSATVQVNVTEGVGQIDPGNPPVTGLETGSELSVYPNPSNGIVYVSIPEGTSGDAVIFDSVGRQLKMKASAANAGTLSYDVSGYSPGLYVISVKLSTGKQLTSRLVVK